MDQHTDFTAFDGPLGQPSDAERRLIEAAAAGSVADCEGLDADARRVSAALVQALATGRFQHSDWPGWALHENGVRLQGASIGDRLDLANRNILAPLMFEACGLTRGIDLDGARIEGDLIFHSCTLTGECRLVSAAIAGQFGANEARFSNPDAVAIAAAGVSAAGWFMDAAEVVGRFDINSAVIAGQFSAEAARFRHDGATAVFAQGVACTGWFMRETRIEGMLDVTSAAISGEFAANQARFANPGDVAIAAQGATVTSWFMHETEIDGQLDLTAATITGQFAATGAAFRNRDATAILAHSVKARGWYMPGASIEGQFYLGSAEIDGQFGADGASFSYPRGTAVHGNFGAFTGGLFLRDVTIVGDIDLTAAEIRKTLDLSGSTLRAGRYRALSLRSTRIFADVTFARTIVYGHIHASRARVEGRFSLRGATLVAATLARRRGAIETEPGDALNETDAERQETFRHHALVMHEARIDGRLVMPQTRTDGIVDLSHTRCDVLEDFAGGWPPPLARKSRHASGRVTVDDGGAETEIEHLVLDGLHYGHFENPGAEPGSDIARARTRWLAAQSADDIKRHFNPQPWRQAAAALRGAGYDEAAQSLTIERRVRERLADETPVMQRFASWLLHLLANYGFNPWKTVGISLALVLACAALFSAGVAACGGYRSVTVAPGACGGQPVFVQVRYQDLEEDVRESGGYPAFSPFFYSLDMFVPLFDLGQESYWRANTNAWMRFDDDAAGAGPAWMPVGWLLYLLAVAERMVGAILIAIAVTGFAGLLTRDER